MKDTTFRVFPEFQLANAEESRKVEKQIYKVYSEGGSITHGTNELRIFYELAHGFHTPPDTPGYVLQCGIFQGGSLCALRMGLKHSKNKYKPAMLCFNNLLRLFYDPVFRRYRGV